MLKNNLSLINDKIKDGSVKILSDNDILKRLKNDPDHGFLDVDIVTLELKASISGSAMMLLIPVAAQGTFTRAEKIWLNGVRGFPGPAPNERLGVIDTLIFADQKVEKGSGDYSGANLFKDIIANKEIEVECLSIEGDTYSSNFTMGKLKFARMYVYNFYLPGVTTEMPGQKMQIGEIFKTIKRGSRILLNKAQGIVAGSGTRSTESNPALSLTADLYDMDQALLTELETEKGTVLSNSVVLAVPMINETVVAETVSWIKRNNKSAGTLNTFENNAANFLKQLIDEKEFVFTESDMLL